MGFTLGLLQFLIKLLLGSIEFISGEGEPLVTAPAGTFRGKVLTSPSGVRYASYRGIPYALPPTGERRFAKPEPFPVIQDAFDATEFKSFCVQPSLLDGSVTGQEDCLFLNVFTPHIQEEASPLPGQKSVLFYIHGGGLVTGNGDLFMGDFITKNDIVVVTINYRLGWLGFLRGNSDSLPGNQGHLDQLLALRWVKDNIRAFGGNPDDITASGTSAGSWSTSVLSISPLSRGLFKRAALFSGTSFLFPTPDHKSNDLLEKAAKQFGCDQKPVAGNEEAVATCLKQKPADIFYIPMYFPLVDTLISSGDAVLPRPISDLQRDPDYLSQSGFYNRSYFVSVVKDDGILHFNSTIQLGHEPSLDSVVQDLSYNLGIDKATIRELLAKYQEIYIDLDKAAIALSNDKYFVGQSYAFVESYATRPKQVSTSQNAYFMSLDPFPDFIPNHYLPHGLDMLYWADFPEKKIMESYYPFINLSKIKEEDYKLRSDFIDLIGTFVKTGNPSPSLEKNNNIEWPPYDKTNKSYLSFSPQPKVLQDIFSNRRNLVFPDQ